MRNTELDFCSNPKKCSNAIVEEKTLQRVNLCIEPGGGIFFPTMEAPGDVFVADMQAIERGQVRGRRPKALKTRLRALRMLGELGPRVAHLGGAR